MIDGRIAFPNLLPSPVKLFSLLDLNFSQKQADETSRGFTQIKLLVVIGLFAGMLLPALVKMELSRLAMSCSSFIQIGRAC
jgi:hypothetical protein